MSSTERPSNARRESNMARSEEEAGRSATHRLSIPPRSSTTFSSSPTSPTRTSTRASIIGPPSSPSLMMMHLPSSYNRPTPALTRHRPTHAADFAHVDIDTTVLPPDYNAPIDPEMFQRKLYEKYRGRLRRTYWLPLLTWVPTFIFVLYYSILTQLQQDRVVLPWFVVIVWLLMLVVILRAYKTRLRRLHNVYNTGLLDTIPIEELNNVVMNGAEIAAAPGYDVYAPRFDEPLPTYAPRLRRTGSVASGWTTRSGRSGRSWRNGFGFMSSSSRPQARDEQPERASSDTGHRPLSTDTIAPPPPLNPVTPATAHIPTTSTRRRLSILLGTSTEGPISSHQPESPSAADQMTLVDSRRSSLDTIVKQPEIIHLDSSPATPIDPSPPTSQPTSSSSATSFLNSSEMDHPPAPPAP
ncbi:hypothetical protein DFS34DRAFT_253616 [Phlyctochytrium arcticum]|nr:hypothetical protein DFS34DRAFT_253616 [Phlyctochytrium arcticum]